MNKPSLTETFRARAQQGLLALCFQNAAARFVFNRAEILSSTAFTVGNIGLMIKNGVSMSAEGTAGFLFLASSLALRFSRSHPTLAFRLCGLCVVTGALVLGSKGVTLSPEMTIDGWKTFGPLIAFGPTGMLIMMQDRIADFATRCAEASNRLVRGCARICRYPVLLGAAFDTAGGLLLLKTAIDEKDTYMKCLLLIWSIGEIGLAASDPRMQEKFKTLNPQ